MLSPKQYLYLITAFLLQTTMVFASAGEANTSAAQSTSEEHYTIGELIEKLTNGGPEIKTSFKESVAKLPLDLKIVNSITRWVVNSAAVEVPVNWITHPLVVQSGLNGSSYLHYAVDTPEMKNNPGYNADILSEIRYAKVLPGTPIIILVDPITGNWVYGVFYNTDKRQDDFCTVPSGSIKVSKSVIFIPVAYFVQDSRQSKVRWQMPKLKFDGVSQQVNPYFPIAEGAWFTIPNAVSKAYRSIDKLSTPTPFGLKIAHFVPEFEYGSDEENLGSYHQAYWEDEDDGTIDTQPYETLISDALKKGGVVGGVIFKNNKNLRVFANPIPQKLPADFLIQERLFSSKWLEKVPGFFGHEGSFPFESKLRWILGRKAKSHKYSTQFLVPFQEGVKSYQITRYQVDPRTPAGSLGTGLIECSRANKAF